MYIVALEVPCIAGGVGAACGALQEATFNVASTRVGSAFSPRARQGREGAQAGKAGRHVGWLAGRAGRRAGGLAGKASAQAGRRG